MLKRGGLMDNKDLWQSVLDEISPEINPASFHSWFAPLKLLKIENNKVSIQVPMEMHRKVLKQYYLTRLDDAFFKLTNENYEFEFLLQGEVDNSSNNKKNVDNVDNLVEVVKQEPKTVNKVKEEDTTWESNLEPELNFENYIVGESNRLAKTSALLVAENPGKVYNPLFIYGKSGLGKTHLMHAIGNYIVLTEVKFFKLKLHRQMLYVLNVIQ